MTPERWAVVAWATFLTGAMALAVGLVLMYAPDGLPSVVVALGGLTLGVGCLFAIAAKQAEEDAERAKRKGGAQC